MNAQQIVRVMNDIKPDMFRIERGIMPENKPIFHEIFEKAGEIEPCKELSDEKQWEFWLWTDRGSFEDFSVAYKEYFTYRPPGMFFSGEEGEVMYDKMREQWPLYYPDETVWFHLRLIEFEGERILTLNENKIIDMRNNDVYIHRVDAGPLLSWILASEKTCIEMIKAGTYSGFIEENLAYKHRSGVTTLETFWNYVPEDKERIFGKIDPKELEELKAWKEEDYGWPDMTSNDYFRICDCLYDVLDLKSKYPMQKKDAPDEVLTPRECYMAYAANYGSVKPFLRLDGDSAEAFDKFVTKGDTEHHTWEVCLVPNIHLYPKKIQGKYYVRMEFDHKVDKYDLLVHLTLEMYKKGMPVIKPKHVLERMQGKAQICIEPDGDLYDWEYAEEANIRTSESRTLPKGASKELIQKIRWFPAKKWTVRK